MTRPLRVALRTLLVLAAALAVGCATLALHRQRILERVRAETALPPGSLEILEPLRIGGIDQWIFVRAANRDAPVLLFLHGGPGAPMIPVAREFEGGLAQHFVVVHWDQRGAGKSFSLSIPRSSMTRERFVSDGIELIERLRTRFGAERIFLAASSWGTVLGADLVSRRPDLFHAFVAMGTSVHGLRSEEISYAFVVDCLRERDDSEGLRRFTEIDPPPYGSVLDIARQRQWLRRCGGMFHDTRKTSFFARYGYASPEYSWLDMLRFNAGELFSGLTMVLDLHRSLDLSSQVPRIEVPVFFFQGRHDRQTPSALVEEYYERLDAPRGKRLFWFERSAHGVYREEPRKFERLLLEKVLPLADPPAAVAAVLENRVSGPRPTDLRDLTPAILRLMDRGRAPGLQLAVWQAGRLVWSRVLGLADVAIGAPVTRETILRAGSISKLITATLVMQRIEAGLLAVDDDVDAHLPVERRIRGTDGKSVRVTLRQPLSHQSGLPALGSRIPDLRLVGLFFGLGPVPDLGRYLARGLLLRRTPGSSLRYSNNAFILLGGLVTDAAGLSFPALARRAVLDPLGMHASDFDPSSRRVRADLASVYADDAGSWVSADARPHGALDQRSRLGARAGEGFRGAIAGQRSTERISFISRTYACWRQVLQVPAASNPVPQPARPGSSRSAESTTSRARQRGP